MKDIQTGDTSYFHGDQIGSLRAVTNTPAGAATVTGRLVYTAFGERVWSDGTIGTRHQYAGAWGYDTLPEFTSGMSPHFDGEPGDDVPFIHVGYRWYDPSSGRFLQRDPIGIAGGLNVYEYVSASPTTGVDPDGLTVIVIQWGERGLLKPGHTAILVTSTCTYISFVPNNIFGTSSASRTPCQDFEKYKKYKIHIWIIDGLDEEKVTREGLKYPGTPWSGWRNCVDCSLKAIAAGGGPPVPPRGLFGIRWPSQARKYLDGTGTQRY